MIDRVDWLFALPQEGFQDSKQRDGDADKLGSINLFVDAWIRFDRNAANYIPITRFVSMMYEAPYPFGLQRENGTKMTMYVYDAGFPSRVDVAMYWRRAFDDTRDHCSWSHLFSLCCYLSNSPWARCPI